MKLLVLFSLLFLSSNLQTTLLPDQVSTSKRFLPVSDIAYEQEQKKETQDSPKKEEEIEEDTEEKDIEFSLYSPFNYEVRYTSPFFLVFCVKQYSKSINLYQKVPLYLLFVTLKIPF